MLMAWDSALTCPRAPTLQVCPALLWKGLSSSRGVLTLQRRAAIRAQQRALALPWRARCGNTSRSISVALSVECANLPQLFRSLPLLCAFGKRLWELPARSSRHFVRMAAAVMRAMARLATKRQSPGVRVISACEVDVPFNSTNAVACRPRQAPASCALQGQKHPKPFRSSTSFML